MRFARTPAMLTHPLLSIFLLLDRSVDDPAGVIVTAVVAIVLMVAAAAIYFLPSVVAIFRNHHNWGAIAVVNLFFGWTFVGWVVALAWSVTGQQKQ